MGFGGGGGGGALPTHVHNAVPLQGGPLDFANDTISSMNAGSTTFSNGAALQELLIGTPGQQLVVNGGATAPAWAPAGGGAFTDEGGDSGDKAALTVTGMTGRDITKVFYQVEPSTIVTTAYPMLRINGENTNYDVVNDVVYASGHSTEVNRTSTGYFLDQENGYNSELVYFGEMTIFAGDPSLAWTGNFLKNQTGSMRTDSNEVSNTIQGAGAQPDTNAITEVSMVMTSGNISGRIQVVTMDFA